MNDNYPIRIFNEFAKHLYKKKLISLQVEQFKMVPKIKMAVNLEFFTTSTISAWFSKVKAP
jgi:hypothetical protein